MLHSVFYNVVPFLVAVTVLVFFHELGHFLVGRWCGVKVETFSLGFGPELFHVTDRKGTRWRLAALPLGGYVKFYGDANAASVPDSELAQATPEERAGSLFAKSVWQRMAIVAAGPIANFIVAIIIFAGLFHFSGEDVISTKVAQVFPGSAAAAAGVEAQDVITAVDGRPIDNFNELKRLMLFSDGSPMEITVRRDGQEKLLVATPRRGEIPALVGTMKTYMLGISPVIDDAHTKRYAVGPAIERGAQEVWFRVAITGHFLKGLFAGRESTDQLSGPIGIAQMSGKVAELGITPFLEIVAIISVSIGLLNLLPIPMLDGGFLLFFLIEAIRGKALPERAQQVGFKIGLTFVAALCLLVTFNDISRQVSQHLSGGASRAPMVDKK